MVKQISHSRFSRQISAFGLEGQERIAACKVGIVGLGGIGSHIAQSLAYLGVLDFVLIDDDRVEDSNLNRLIGGSEQDLYPPQPKVAVASRTIHFIMPQAQVLLLDVNLRTQEAISALQFCDVLFGCVDRDGARLMLSEFAAAYSIPLVDCATEILLEQDGFSLIGGRVVFALPGECCALCAGQIDLEIARQELESHEEREFRHAHGYGLGNNTPAPAVVSLNGVIANLAVSEFLFYITETKKPEKLLTYYANRGVVNRRDNIDNSVCTICQTLVGKAEAANIRRYLRSGLPTDLPR